MTGFTRILACRGERGLYSVRRRALEPRGVDFAGISGCNGERRKRGGSIVELVIIVSMLALIEYVVFGALVGANRAKHGVKAPAVTGNETFERYFRVQQNTLEQLIVFLPAIWSFGYLVDYRWAAAIGIIYVIGRVLYLRAYVSDPNKRGPGMMLSAIPSYFMILGALGAAVWSLLI
jgi:glutathione S-transferase